MTVEELQTQIVALELRIQTLEDEVWRLQQTPVKVPTAPIGSYIIGT